MAGWRQCRWGAWLALLALLGNLLVPVSGIAAMPAGPDTAICYGGASAPAAPSHHHGATDCGFCAFCHCLGTDAGLAPPAPPALPVSLPAKSDEIGRASAFSPARVAAARPPARAPPSQV